MPGSAKEIMKSDTLPVSLRKWSRAYPSSIATSESVRADLRRKVRRLLAMYGYQLANSCVELGRPNCYSGHAYMYR
jgi:hypothetical protein